MKWRTELEIVNSETGELLKKSDVIRGDYIIKQKEKKYTSKEYLDKGYHGKIIKQNIIKITWICITNPQQKMW